MKEADRALFARTLARANALAKSFYTREPLNKEENLHLQAAVMIAAGIHMLQALDDPAKVAKIVGKAAAAAITDEGETGDEGKLPPA